MIEERAVVVESSDQGVLVTTPTRAGCARCAEGRGCGGGVLGRLTERRSQPVVMATNASGGGLAAGDAVIVGLKDEALVSASLSVYVAPLVLMLVTAVTAHWLFAASEPLVVTAGICGLLGGFGWVARRARQPGWAERYQPVVLRRANGETAEFCDTEPSGT